MDVEGLYRELKEVQDSGKIGNAYNGCGFIDDRFNGVLDEFYEYIQEIYKESMSPWAEAFVQIFDWQFQTMHESAEAYYENFYGNSDYRTILRVADFLRENGYLEILMPYAAAAVDCERYHYPEEKNHLLPDSWVDEHEEAIWSFYVDVLEKYKEVLEKHKEEQIKI